MKTKKAEIGEPEGRMQNERRILPLRGMGKSTEVLDEKGVGTLR